MLKIVANCTLFKEHFITTCPLMSILAVAYCLSILPTIDNS
jgi:hypothetical protein